MNSNYVLALLLADFAGFWLGIAVTIYWFTGELNALRRELAQSSKLEPYL